MDFLGSLGIDVKLLIAQIVNFGLLLWLLTKFLYKPIIKRIEKDEKELKQAQLLKKELEIQRNDFIEQEKKELVKSKNQAREIIKEADTIAKEIKENIQEKTNKEAEAIINQSKEKLKSLRYGIEKDILKNIKTKIGISFQESFLSSLSPSSQKEIQNVLWLDFVKQVNQLVLGEIKEPNLSEILKEINSTKKELNNGKDRLEKKLEEVFSQKIGAIILEYVYPLETEQEKELEEMISEKIGIKLNIIKKQNKDLINGFRLEISGIIIENNLLNIINDATSFKK